MNLHAVSTAKAVDRLADFFEALSPATLHELDALYAAEARFKDPFNEVLGVAAIRRIFEHMFASVDTPRFVVTTRIVDGDQAMLEFQSSLDDIQINGVDIIRWNEEGKIIDFKVMVRPLKAINKVWEKMGEMLAAQAR